MKISIRSPFAPFKIHTMDLPITKEELDEYMNDNSTSIQQIFPQLNADQREFLMTGISIGEYPGDNNDRA